MSTAAPLPSAFNPVVGGKLNCNMDGYVKMTKEIGRLVLILVTWFKETWGAVLPDNLKLATDYLYEFMLGVGSWIGYATAAAYFFSDEFGFGEQMCDLSGYGYEVIDALQVLVTFTEPPPKANAASTTY